MAGLFAAQVIDLDPVCDFVSTCLYDEATADLAELLRDATERGEPIDHLFSRKRSLRARIKRQGRQGLDEADGMDDA